MKIISYAWTTPALLALRKRKTRRSWADKYAQSFHDGDLVQAYDRSPRVGGKRVAIVRLLLDPYPQRTGKMTFVDFEDEGFKYLEEQGIRIQNMTPMDFFLWWRKQDELVWVIEFEVVSLEGE